MIAARIQSVARAAGLLDAMAGGDWVALRDLARRIGTARTTAFNLLGALVDVGLVERDSARGCYRLGLLHLVYGRAVERRMDMVELIRPFLVRLCAETRETVNLALPAATDAIIVESLESNRTLRVSAYAGTRADYHATACGRALIAWRDAAFRDAVFDLGPLSARTPRTTTDRAALNALLAQCRARGWASEFEENEIGSACVAAPIFDADHQPIASVSVAGPASRFTPAAMADLGALLVCRMADISAALDRAAHTPPRCAAAGGQAVG
jgi:IclR family acetate operon transcriptional repressor